MSSHAERQFDERVDDIVHKILPAFGTSAEQLRQAGELEIAEDLNDAIAEIMRDAGVTGDNLRPGRNYEDRTDDPVINARERVLAMLDLQEEDVDFAALTDHIFVLSDRMADLEEGAEGPGM